MMNWQSVYWYLIKRGDRYAIRVKDTLSQERQYLETIPSFPLKKEWIKNAIYLPAASNESIEIKNIIGITYESKFMGQIQFKHNDKTYELTATSGSDNNLFIVFGDLTNGSETHGGGRFIYVDIPEKGNEVVIDFNQAENPICAFNDYATCPLPMKENQLPFRVDGGEKRVRDNNE
jgi:uncharacterized protein (DUF1684 family)